MHVCSRPLLLLVLLVLLLHATLPIRGCLHHGREVAVEVSPMDGLKGGTRRNRTEVPGIFVRLKNAKKPKNLLHLADLAASPLKVRSPIQSPRLGRRKESKMCSDLTTMMIHKRLHINSFDDCREKRQLLYKCVAKYRFLLKSAEGYFKFLPHFCTGKVEGCHSTIYSGVESPSFRKGRRDGQNK